MLTELFGAEASVGLTWAGIAFCVSQSAMFSGLNLAYFGVSRLSLEVDAGTGSIAAARVLQMRKDSNFLLVTILWGNVGINVLLALLSNSIMAGVAAFIFSTVIITLIGEIIPQAYFSRNALWMGELFAPVMRLYQILLYPLAKPIALLLDLWLGKEGIQYLKERQMRGIIRQHMGADGSDIDKIEGLGALNFLSIDDIPTSQEGEPLDPRSVITLPIEGDKPIFPAGAGSRDSVFFRQLQASGKKWVVLTDADGTPHLVVDTDGYMRGALIEPETFEPMRYCHRPIIVRDASIRLGHVLQQLEVQPEYAGDNVIDRDVILLWTEQRRVITGSDILGRLLAGISNVR